MIAKINDYFVKELNLAEEEGNKMTKFVDRMNRTTLEMF